MRVFTIAIAGLTAATLAAPVAHAQTRNPDTNQRSERVQMPRPGRVSMIGVRLSDVEADQVKTYKLSKAEGAVVERVNPNSPAATAGLREKDVIVEFDGERVRSASHMTRLITETPAGREVALVVMRDGKRTNLHLKPEAGNGSTGWFDPTFGGVIDREQMRQYAEEAEKAMRDMGRTMMPGRARLGVSVQQMTPDLAEYFGVKSGVLVTSVARDSAAAKAGLKAGDVITAVDGTSVSTPAELVSALPSGDGQHDVTVTYVRDKQQHSAKVSIGSTSTTAL